MSAGSIVTVEADVIDELAAGMAGGTNILLEKFTQVFDLVDTTSAAFTTAMTELDAAALALALPVDFGDVVDVAFDAISEFSIGTAPAMSSITLPGYDTIVFPTAPAYPEGSPDPTYQNVPTIDLLYTEPEFPASVNPALGYTDAVYDETTWTVLFEKVNAALATPGSGLGASIEDGIWTRDLARAQTEIDKAYLRATDEIASRSLPFPAPALRALEQEMSAEILRVNSDKSFTIAAEQAKLALQNTQFYVSQSASLESVARKFFIDFQLLTLDARKAAANLVMQNYTTAINGYTAHWQGISTKLEAEMKKVDSVINQNKMITEAFTAMFNVKLAEVDMVSKVREGMLEGLKTDADVYKSRVQAAAAWYDALSAKQQAEVKKGELLLNQALGKLNAQIAGLGSLNSLKERILETKAQVLAQVLASSLNAVNTSVSHSTSASESRQEAWSHSESLSESHTTEHDPAA